MVAHRCFTSHLQINQKVKKERGKIIITTIIMRPAIFTISKVGRIVYSKEGTKISKKCNLKGSCLSQKRLKLMCLKKIAWSDEKL